MVKKDCYQACFAFITARIANIKHAIEQAQQASADDTKSSAGDKYETTREMMQQEIDRNQRQLMEAGQQLQLLKQLENVGTAEKIKVGSLVLTNQGWFYLSISAGELKADGKGFFAISQASPIGKLLLAKSVGTNFIFNGKTITIDQLL